LFANSNRHTLSARGIKRYLLAEIELKTKTPYNMSFACFVCCKSFKREFNLSKGCPETLICPNCGGKAINLGRHFKPPQETDKKQWKKVRFLVDHGFRFQKVYDKDNAGLHIPYPETLEQAKEFVDRWKQYALK
jgi:hypothetical protein